MRTRRAPAGDALTRGEKIIRLAVTARADVAADAV